MLISIARPSADSVHEYLESLRDAPFSYEEVGTVARGVVPPGFVEDHNRVRLGQGADAFRIATRAIRAWTMFALDWIEVRPPDAPIAVGTAVAIVARSFGAWTVNPARIVAVIDENGGPVDRFGFAYGSLPGHAESGEEQFSVEWRRDDDSVWYDLHGISKPGRWFTQLAVPLTRRVQKRFARESKAAMAAFVGKGGES